MRILFILTLTSLVRHFESVILALAERGHTIRIATPGRSTNWPLPDAIKAHARISEVVCPEERSDEWKTAARIFRLLVDYRRFLEPPFLQAEKLRERAYRELVEALAERHVGDEALSASQRATSDALLALFASTGGPAASAEASAPREGPPL